MCVNIEVGATRGHREPCPINSRTRSIAVGQISRFRAQNAGGRAWPWEGVPQALFDVCSHSVIWFPAAQKLLAVRPSLRPGDLMMAVVHVGGGTPPLGPRLSAAHQTQQLQTPAPPHNKDDSFPGQRDDGLRCVHHMMLICSSCKSLSACCCTGTVV